MKEVKWTKLADNSFDRIINYLKKNWTEKEIKNFLFALQSTIIKIRKYPETSIAIKDKEFRRAVIDKNNNLIFKVRPNLLVILYVWDSRQNPQKHKKLIEKI